MPQLLSVKTPDTPKWAADLSPVEIRFVTEFVVDLNATAAGLRAGLGRGTNKKSAGSAASRMRKRASVAEAISILLAEKSGITATAVIGELGSIAFSRITDYLKLENGRLVLAVSDLNELSDEAKAAISRLKERVNDDGSISIDVELHDKTAALTQLGKSVGVFKERPAPPRDDESDYEAGESARRKIEEMLARTRRNLEAQEMVEVESPLSRAVLPPAKRVGPLIEHEPQR